MRFQVPQFIDVEDKIFGPFTLKQFIYLAGGAAVVLVATTFLGVFWGIFLSSPVILASLALAFYKVNNRPFINILESAFHYIRKDKLYIWQKKKEEEKETQYKPIKKYSSIVVPSLSGSKLKDMNWQLDVQKKEDDLLAKS